MPQKERGEFVTGNAKPEPSEQNDHSCAEFAAFYQE
jgi:hypothetical protein